MNQQRTALKLPLPLIIFLLVRVPILLALPFDGLRGYGDMKLFVDLAAIPGLPFFNYWIEYPPGFAFLNELIYFMAGGVEHVFTYLFILLLLAADIGNVLLFCRLEKLLYPNDPAPTWRSLIYAALIAGLPYTWWYYDSLVVFFTLLAVYFLFTRRNTGLVGGILGIGVVLKLFPAILLPAIIRSNPLRRSATIASISLALFIIPMISLYAVSPAFTRAYLTAQSSRGSTATIWAIIDGNYFRAGGFGPLIERLDPATAAATDRNLPVIPPYLLLVAFGALGLLLFWKARLDTPNKVLAFYGLAMVIFFLWSPAWSPQWVLYLIPVCLLVLPYSPGLLLTAVLVLANLLEWPLLLSRGLFYTYPLTILIRFALMVLLGVLFYQQTREPDRA